MPEIVLPHEPGLHLVVDQPQGQGGPVLSSFVTSALEHGMPVVAVLLDQATPQFRAKLKRHGVELDALEEAGHLVYVDAFSVRVGWAHTDPHTVFVEEQGPDPILLGLSEAQSGIVDKAANHLVLVDSLSSLLVLEGLAPTYAFVQSLSSLAPRLGAVSVARLVAGMHPREEHTAMLQLASTVIDTTQHPQDPTRATARDADRWRS